MNAKRVFGCVVLPLIVGILFVKSVTPISGLVSAGPPASPRHYVPRCDPPENDYLQPTNLSPGYAAEQGDVSVSVEEGKKILAEQKEPQQKRKFKPEPTYPGSAVIDLTDEEYQSFKKWRTAYRRDPRAVSQFLDNQSDKPRTLFHLSGNDTSILITIDGERLTPEMLNRLVMELDQSDRAKRIFDRCYERALKRPAKPQEK
jgi:hypothetical protein